jgi:hypothetical protein
VTREEIDRAVAIFASVGKRIPICPHEWREWELHKMATRIGKATVTKDGKVKKIDTANVSQKIGRKAKADRIEKGLRANRARAKGGA